MRLRSIVFLAALATTAAHAENAERGQPAAEEELVPKLDLLCGVHLAVRYDLASLKANNKDIGWDQTSGSLECDEPLRLLWTLCQTDAGKAAVRKAEVREVQCRGIAGNVGRLSVKNGVVLVERAYEEKTPFLRARTQFEKDLGLRVALQVADPYYDEAWREFRAAPAPVTSTTDYCLVNGAKEKLDLSAASRVRGEGTVKCLKGGAVVVDLVLKGGKRTGLDRAERDDWCRVERLVDDRREGRIEEFKKGVLVNQSEWKAGERVWSKDFNDAGKLKDYSRQYPKGLATVRFDAEGRVSSLMCLPDVRDDEVLASWCGFRGEKTVQLYDGTGKVSAVRTFRDGQLVREAPGDSHYGSRTAVSYVDGKKHGEERITREDGTLERTLQWKAGVQEGADETFDKDGKKVVRRRAWKGGVLVEDTEFFLNGNPKRRESLDGDVMQRTSWFDLGQKEGEVRLVRCRRTWCEDGPEQRWFENGKLAEEANWKAGQREGDTKRWFASGGRRTEERWAKGVRLSRKEWDEQGALLADDEFEEDGSRKLKR